MLFDVSKPNEVSQKQKQINEKKFTSWAEAYFSSQNYKQTNNQKLNQGCTVLKTHFQRYLTFRRQLRLPNAQKQNEQSNYPITKARQN